MLVPPKAGFKYLDKSPEFFWVPPGYSSAISFDSVASVIRLNASKFRIVDNTWDTLRVLKHTQELASYTGKITSVMTDTAGSVEKYSLIETGLVVRRSDGWKLLCGQTSMLQK